MIVMRIMVHHRSICYAFEPATKSSHAPEKGDTQEGDRQEGDSRQESKPEAEACQGLRGPRKVIGERQGFPLPLSLAAPLLARAEAAAMRSAQPPPWVSSGHPSPRPFSIRPLTPTSLSPRNPV